MAKLLEVESDTSFHLFLRPIYQVLSPAQGSYRWLSGRSFCASSKNLMLVENNYPLISLLPSSHPLTLNAHVHTHAHTHTHTDPGIPISSSPGPRSELGAQQLRPPQKIKPSSVLLALRNLPETSIARPH